MRKRINMKKASDFFSPEQQAEIVAAVTAAETTTRCEIVPMVVSCSDDYPQVDLLAGGGLALIVTLATDYLLGIHSTWLILLLLVISTLILSQIVRRLPWLKRKLIHPRELDATVHNKALTSFMSEGLHQTPENIGVLILISLFEHRVEIVADSGIGDKIAPATWKELVDLLTKGIKQGQAGETLCRVINETATILAEHFPPGTSDTNHLPNLILNKRDQNN
jgi:putative membrane protein